MRARVTIGTRGAARSGMDTTDMRSTKPTPEPPSHEPAASEACRANGYRITPEGSAHVGARVTKLKALAVASPVKFRRVVLNAFIEARGILIDTLRVLERKGTPCSKGTLHRPTNERPRIRRDVETIREVFRAEVFREDEASVDVDLAALRKTLKIRAD